MAQFQTEFRPPALSLKQVSTVEEGTKAPPNTPTHSNEHPLALADVRSPLSNGKLRADFEAHLISQGILTKK
jgi:hypothetical protein